MFPDAKEVNTPEALAANRPDRRRCLVHSVAGRRLNQSVNSLDWSFINTYLTVL